MMASARSWRPLAQIEGPFVARVEEIPSLNVVFSDAFTERYRRDGMVGVRVPYLNPSVWRYAIEDAAEGAMVWRDGRGEIAAFNMVHRSGIEGWMGPLAVRTEYQGSGVGKDIVERGVDWLKRQDARIIGLETMPRTMDNIGFYSSLGFAPGRLTITLTLDAVAADHPPELLGRLGSRDREESLAEAQGLVQRLAPGYDFTREVELTESLALEDERYIDPLVHALCDFAKRGGTRRVALRVQGEYSGLYRRLVSLGARVRWTDLRMSLAGYEEQRPSQGIVLSNWEI
jgi:GNAT superfamily N-acetyltransferase